MGWTLKQEHNQWWKWKKLSAYTPKFEINPTRSRQWAEPAAGWVKEGRSALPVDGGAGVLPRKIF